MDPTGIKTGMILQLPTFGETSNLSRSWEGFATLAFISGPDGFHITFWTFEIYGKTYM